MTNYHYPSQSHMMGANPYIAFLLVNIAALVDGVYIARENGRIYSWNAKHIRDDG